MDAISAMPGPSGTVVAMAVKALEALMYAGSIGLAAGTAG